MDLSIRSGFWSDAMCSIRDANPSTMSPLVHGDEVAILTPLTPDVSAAVQGLGILASGSHKRATHGIGVIANVSGTYELRDLATPWTTPESS